MSLTPTSNLIDRNTASDIGVRQQQPEDETLYYARVGVRALRQPSTFNFDPPQEQELMDGSKIQLSDQEAPHVKVHHDTLSETEIPVLDMTVKDIVDNKGKASGIGAVLGGGLGYGMYAVGINTLDRAISASGGFADVLTLGKAAYGLYSGSKEIADNEKCEKYYKESKSRFNEEFNKYIDKNSTEVERSSSLEIMRGLACGANEHGKAQQNLEMLHREKTQNWVDVGAGVANLLVKDIPKLASAFGGDTPLGSAVQTQAFGVMAGNTLSIVTGTYQAITAYNYNEELESIRKNNVDAMKQARTDLEKPTEKSTESENTKRFAKHSIKKLSSDKEKQGISFMGGVCSALSGVTTALTTSLGGIFGITTTSLASAIGIGAGAAAFIAAGGLLLFGASLVTIVCGLVKSYNHSREDHELLEGSGGNNFRADLDAAKIKIAGNGDNQFKVITDKFLKSLPEDMKSLAVDHFKQSPIEPMAKIRDMLLSNDDNDPLHKYAVTFMKNFGGDELSSHLKKFSPDMATEFIKNHLLDEFAKLEIAKELPDYALDRFCEDLRDDKKTTFRFLEKAMGKSDALSLKLAAQSGDDGFAIARERIAQAFLVHR